MDFNTHVRRSTVTTVKKSDKKTFSKQQKSQKVMFSKYGQEKKYVREKMIFKALAKVFKAKLFLGSNFL